MINCSVFCDGTSWHGVPELWHILNLWLAKMPNGGMPVFTLIATGWRYRKIFFYKKSTVYQRPTPLPWVGPIGAFCRHTYRTLHIAVVCRLQYLPMLSAGRKAPKIAPSRGESGPPPNTCFLWPLSPSHANGISIASSVFVGLTVVTNRHRHTQTHAIQL